MSDFTALYKRNYGRGPYGYGDWAFEGTDGKIYWGLGLYTDAKRKATKAAKAAGVRLVRLLP